MKTSGIRHRAERYFTLIFFSIPATWAGSFIAAKYVVADADPLSSVFWRFFLSALCMFPFLVLWHRRAHPGFWQRDFLFHLVIVVLTGGIGYHIFFFWALEYTSPTNTALVIALNPFFTAFAERIFFRIPRSTRFYFGFFIAFGGAIWVILSRGQGLTLPGKGEFLCLLASLSWSVYTILAKATRKQNWDSLWIGAYNYLFTAILLIPFLPGLLNPDTWLAYTSSTWYGLWYMAIFPTAIGYTMFYIGVQKRGPAWAVTFIYLVPSITANLDHLFFGAPFTIPMVVGTTLVVLGLLTGNLQVHQMQRFSIFMQKAIKKISP